MSSSPARNNTGTATNTRRPAYGFVSQPSSSIATRTTNSTAIAVAMAMPSRDSGLRAATGSRIGVRIAGPGCGLLQALHVSDERIQVILGQGGVRLHDWLTRGLSFGRHLGRG